MSEDSESLASLIEKLKNCDEQAILDIPVEEVQKEDLWKWKVYGDWPCFKCLYNLKGLQGPEVTCPECGQNNDLRRLPLWEKAASPGAVGRIRDLSSIFTSIFIVVFMSASLSNAIDGAWGWVLISVGLTLFVFWLWTRQIRRWLGLLKNRAWGCFLILIAHISLYFALSIQGLTLYDEIGWDVAWFIPSCLIGAAGLMWVDRQLRRVVKMREHTMTWVCWPIAARERYDD